MATTTIATLMPDHALLQKLGIADLQVDAHDPRLAYRAVRGEELSPRDGAEEEHHRDQRRRT